MKLHTTTETTFTQSYHLIQCSLTDRVTAKTFGLLPDGGLIWLDFAGFKHHNIEEVTGLMCVLLAMVHRPVSFAVTADQ